MPHLKFANRYWHVAGDELSVPGICSMSARIFWTALITTVYACSYDQLDDCGSGWILQTYLLVSIGIFLLSILCDALIISASLKGTMIATEDRKNIGTYLVYKFGLTVVEIICSIFGVLTLLLGSIMPCNADVENSSWTKAFVALVVASQIIDGIILCCCCHCLQTLEKDHEELQGIHENEAIELWTNRCQSLQRFVTLMFCNIFGGNNIDEGFEQVARVLTTFFHHNGFLDVVASDVVAGFILVRVEQKFRRQQFLLQQQQVVYTEQPPSPTHQVSPLYSSSKPQNALEEGSLHVEQIDYVEGGGASGKGQIKLSPRLAPSLGGDHYSIEELDNWFRCFVFALSIYTHIMMLYMNPCTGWCRLSCSCCFQNPFCSFCCKPRSKKPHRAKYYSKLHPQNAVIVEGDNRMRLHYTGMKGLMDYITDAELIYVSYKNDTVHKPYGIFLDHEKEWVVIALRGTLSLEDCVTDVICDPVEMTEGKEWGYDGDNRYAHGGMFRAALFIRKELERSRILSKLFGTTGSNTMTSVNTTPLTASGSYANYKLVVTGHSLGAGTAVLLACLLRATHPTLHCYAYGTPGSVVDAQTAQDVASFVTTIAFGNDLVCRLSFPSLCQLRNDVLEAISRARVNKMLIMKAMFRKMSPDDLMYPPGEEPDTEFKRSVQQFKQHIQQRSVELAQHPLTLPGKIIHFRRDFSVAPDCCSQQPTHFPHTVTQAEFQEIVVSTTMGSDHLPDRYLYGLMKVRDHYLQNRMDV